MVQKPFRTTENESFENEFAKKSTQCYINQLGYFLTLPFWMRLVINLF